MKNYSTWLFDCDGVLLDSNAIKTEAFRIVAESYGAEAAEALVFYHKNHGGISRYKKFQYLFQDVLKKTDFQKEYDQALEEYAEKVRSGLMQCTEVSGVRDFLQHVVSLDNRQLYVISGSDQDELRHILHKRELSPFFNEIYGSPTHKRELLKSIREEEEAAGRQWNAILFGDSQIDFEVAHEQGADFIMVYGHTEWHDWDQTLPQDIRRISDFTELI